ncbi:MAG: 50S ribosomal protein L4, partial [Cytophagales bacterium]|nr:50S ribosomal protein L4 [Cytophagales bacterium]
MKLEILNGTGEKTGRTVKIPDLLLEEKKQESSAHHVVYLEIKRYQAAQRSGNHKVKERGEIRGSTRKIRKQKGTGAARAGSIKSPLFRGGGTIFGPRSNRNYNLSLNKKVRRQARRIIFTHLLKEKRVLVVEPVDFEKPNTKSYVDFLAKLGIREKKKNSL